MKTKATLLDLIYVKSDGFYLWNKTSRKKSYPSVQVTFTNGTKHKNNPTGYDIRFSIKNPLWELEEKTYRENHEEYTLWLNLEQARKLWLFLNKIYGNSGNIDNVTKGQ